MSTNQKPTGPSRKGDHLDLCITGDVAFRRKSNLFEEVELIHEPLPELALEEIDLTTTFAGKTLQAPLIIAAMTGGVERANKINKDLAALAEEFGIGFAFGSQRPLLTKKITAGYMVREEAPNALVLGNIGIVQAAESGTAAIEEMLQISGADALCIHLNPAMELVQPEGDHDFRGGIETIQRLMEELPCPVIVKETGCGIGLATAKRLKKLGVKWVDVSGAGGTSWVAVERHRAKEQKRNLGDTFWDWGIPTAASVAQISDLKMGVCATGGIDNGLMIAKAISLGATCGGIARKFLQAHATGGINETRQVIRQVIHEIRVACLLCGAQKPIELQKKPIVIGANLRRWIPSESSVLKRTF